MLFQSSWMFEPLAGLIFYLLLDSFCLLGQISLLWHCINNYPRMRAHFMCMSCWILHWPEGIDISVIVLCTRLLHRMCIVEGSLALDTPQNKSRSRFLFQAYDKWTNNVEVNLGLDWPQTLVRGCQFTFTYTTKSFVFLPSQITEWTSRLDNINCRQISKILSECFKEAIKRLARINESSTRLR